MRENVEVRSKRILIKQAIKAVAGVFLYFSTLSVANAQEDFVLNNVTGTFHEESGVGVADFIRWMESQGRINVLASELVLALHERRTIPPSYTITVDDGRSEQMGILDVLSRLNRRATFFVMGRWNGDGVHRYMSDDDKRKIAHSGNELGAHTDNHPKNLPELFFINHGAFLQEVVGSKVYLEKLTGKKVLVFAYPYGRVTSEDGLRIISNHYYGAYTTISGSVHRLSQSNRLPRYGMN